MSESARSRRAVIALGSNLGQRLEHLQAALDLLDATPGVDVEAVSPVYETAPVGGPEQPDYLNAVVLVRTTLSPEALLARAHAVEAERGRVREQRWGPRTLDVDVVQVEGERRTGTDLVLPHPRAQERAFVLQPWSDVEATAVLDGHGPVAGLLDRLAAQSDVRRRRDLVLAVRE